MSLHATGSSWARGTSASCAQCHNNEGYIDYLSGNFATLMTSGVSAGKTVQSVNPDGYTASNAISCNGCHNEHRSFDFAQDGNDYAVRNIAPVSLVIDPAVSIDFANNSDPLGLSNACTVCHQPRDSYPVPTGTADVEVTSSRYGPHHGPQATLLDGIMAANISGSAGYPGSGGNGDNAHRTGSSCIACHMTPSADNTEGGHLWSPNEESCTVCHTSGAPSEVTGFATDFATLHDLLVGLGAITETGSTVPGTYPVAVAQAVWNYKTLEEDKSKGIHNPKYSKALLKNSIDAIK
jgi:hypothetical protein